MTHRIELKAGADPDGFRRAVRALVAQDAMPEDVAWATQDTPDLFGAATLGEAPPVALPRAVGELAELVVCHRDPERYALLYTLIWRIIHGERALLEVQSDPLVHRLAMMAKAVGRDLHKMHAFVRFRRAETDDGERFIAWFEPDHFIVEATAGFFVDRFPGHEMVDPDAGRLTALERRRACRRPARGTQRRARQRRRRAGLARLL